MAKGNLTVYAALAGNGAVLVAIFIAAAASGSSSLLAEALHSVADTSDSALLLFGEHRSKRPPDDLHPFGHGRELYFWAMVVALAIFAIGVASVIEGFSRIKTPEPLEDPKWSYIVLAASFVFESITCVIAFRQFRKGMKPGEGYWEAYRTAKDPTVFMVLFEDSAALVGLFLAFLGVWLSHHFLKPWIDGAASVAIGLLLMTIAVFLCREVQQLLVGERVDKELLKQLREVASELEGIERVADVKTMHHAPEDILAIFQLKFGDDSDARALEQTTSQLKATLKERHPEVKQVYVALPT